MNPSPALVAGPLQPATAFTPAHLNSAPGADGLRIQAGDRVGYEVSDGFWVPGSILHLDRSVYGEPTAWLLIAAPDLPSLDSVRVDRCIRLTPRRRRPARQRLS